MQQDVDFIIQDGKFYLDADILIKRYSRMISTMMKGAEYADPEFIPNIEGMQFIINAIESEVREITNPDEFTNEIEMGN